MADCDNDTQLQRFAAELRAAPVPIGDDARERILAAARAGRDAGDGAPDAPGPRLELVPAAAEPPRRGPLAWLVRRRPVTLSPLAAAALAASLVGVGVVGARALSGRDSASGTRHPATALVSSRRSEASRSDDSRVSGPISIQFVLVAPRASSVELVGDFNDWRALPMRAAAQGGVWTVTVPLTPGRHTYSFVVDGSTWMADPAAPYAPEDGFGSRNSVIMVGEAST